MGLMKNKNVFIVLVSGKRCTGKDYACDQAIDYLVNSHNLNCIKISHSDMVKQLFCEQTGANLDKMLVDREYKELHRNKMIEFAQKQQRSNPVILSEFVLEKILNTKSTQTTIVFISDFRRKMEQSFFEQAFGPKKIMTIRINSSNENREKRGWKYDPIKDTRYTECELDDKSNWSLMFNNNGTKDDVNKWVRNDLLNYLIDVFFYTKKIKESALL